MPIEQAAHFHAFVFVVVTDGDDPVDQPIPHYMESVDPAGLCRHGVVFTNVAVAVRGLGMTLRKVRPDLSQNLVVVARHVGDRVSWQALHYDKIAVDHVPGVVVDDDGCHRNRGFSMRSVWIPGSWCIISFS